MSVLDTLELFKITHIFRKKKNSLKSWSEIGLVKSRSIKYKDRFFKLFEKYSSNITQMWKDRLFSELVLLVIATMNSICRIACKARKEAIKPYYTVTNENKLSFLNRYVYSKFLHQMIRWVVMKSRPLWDRYVYN